MRSSGQPANDSRYIRTVHGLRVVINRRPDRFLGASLWAGRCDHRQFSCDTAGMPASIRSTPTSSSLVVMRILSSTERSRPASVCRRAVLHREFELAQANQAIAVLPLRNNKGWPTIFRLQSGSRAYMAAPAMQKRYFDHPRHVSCALTRADGVDARENSGEGGRGCSGFLNYIFVFKELQGRRPVRNLEFERVSRA